ncbi:MAG: phosphate signaling complex protein PhoU [Planctomycetota bacterium]|nr:phosphate signaling complex protein PhoU [Planctomycetota bacterium]
MPIHLHRDLDHLAKEVLSLGALVEEATNHAIEALIHRRPELAERVLQGDDQIDQREVEVEIDCLKMLALHQPVAADLRYIVAVLKVNNDLERMGDLAVNVAERAHYLAQHDPIGVSLDFETMGELVKRMVRDCLDAVVRRDVDVARRVMADDDRVDEINRGMFGILEQAMNKDPSTIKRAVHLLSASRHLERIADLATNIAEDVVFMVDGAVIRHQPEGDA